MHKAAIGAAAANAHFVRVAVTWPKNMLHDARMAGLEKLRRSIRSTDEWQLRAVHVGRGEIVWQDRCDAANGSKEPEAAIGLAEVFAAAANRCACVSVQASYEDDG
ncbi:MAG: hypothetical protein ACI9TZ_003447 [Yoonia sp.]|jgi:hypothetical protein